MPLRSYMPHDPNLNPHQTRERSVPVARAIGVAVGTILFLHGGRNILQPEGIALVGLPATEVIAGGGEMLAGGALVALALKRQEEQNPKN